MCLRNGNCGVYSEAKIPRRGGKKMINAICVTRDSCKLSIVLPAPSTLFRVGCERCSINIRRINYLTMSKRF